MKSNRNPRPARKPLTSAERALKRMEARAAFVYDKRTLENDLIQRAIIGCVYAGIKECIDTLSEELARDAKGGRK